jgi:hypothetical protein
MRKLTLVNVYCLQLKFSFFVQLFYDQHGELDVSRIELDEILYLLKNKLKTNRALHPVIVVGSAWLFPKEAS